MRASIKEIVLGGWLGQIDFVDEVVVGEWNVLLVFYGCDFGGLYPVSITWALRGRSGSYLETEPNYGIPDEVKTLLKLFVIHNGER